MDLKNKSYLVVSESSLRLRSAKRDDLTVLGECTLDIFHGNLEYFHNVLVVIADIKK